MTRRRTITPATIRRLALDFPEATAGAHFYRPDFRVRNKIFAALPDGGRIVGLKSTPSNVDALVSADAVTFTDLWRGRWLGVRLDRVSLPVLKELMEDAWCLVAPKRLATAWTQSVTSVKSPSRRLKRT
jgi:hypothetical protein